MRTSFSLHPSMPHLSLHIKRTASGRRIFLFALAVYSGLYALIVGGILLFQPLVRCNVYYSKQALRFHQTKE